MINIIKITTFVAAVALLAFHAPLAILAAATFVGVRFFMECKAKASMKNEGIY